MTPLTIDFESEEFKCWASSLNWERNKAPRQSPSDKKKDKAVRLFQAVVDALRMDCTKYEDYEALVDALIDCARD